MDNQEIAIGQSDQNEVRFNRPNLLIRIKSMLADSMVIIMLMIIASIILNVLQVESGVVRGITFVLILMYEPIMVAINIRTKNDGFAR